MKIATGREARTPGAGHRRRGVRGSWRPLHARARAALSSTYPRLSSPARTDKLDPR
jgi:hypothetical protein